MNREIEFRGQDFFTGEWVFGSLHKNEVGDLFILTDKGDFRAKPETVGQFTTHRDCKDNKIYEGDILAIEQKEGFVPFGVVRWQTDRFIIDDNFGKYIDLDKAPISKMLEKYNFKVINNIHDNPELKKGGLNANPF